jgi:hypothetical protein
LTTPIQQPLYRCDAGRLTDLDLQRFLSDLSRAEKAGKVLLVFKCQLIFGYFIQLSFLPVASVSFTPSLAPIHTQEDQLGLSEKHAHLVRSFESMSLLEPHRNFVNLLFIYPVYYFNFLIYPVYYFNFW